MDITFTPEQQDYRLRARQWLDENLPADWERSDFHGPEDDDEFAKFQIDWEKRLYAAGYLGIVWPREYGGQGLGIVEHFIVSEELGRRVAPEGVNNNGRELVAPILMADGTEEQKRRFVPRILRTDDIWCQGFSEPGAGSDLAALQTRAVRDGDDWVINGQKVWTSFARYANWCILLARSDPAAKPHRGITLFLLPMDTPGVVVRPLRQITGRHEFAELFLEDVRIPDSLRLGQVHDGWNVAMRVFGFERGISRMYRQQRFVHELGELIRAAAPRDLANPASRQALAETYEQLWLMRLRNLRIVSRIASGEPAGPEASLHKLAWSEAHRKFTGLAADLLGDRFDADPALARFRELYLQARAETIYAGTSEIQRNIIAERVLGLPR